MVGLFLTAGAGDRRGNGRPCYPPCPCRLPSLGLMMIVGLRVVVDHLVVLLYLPLFPTGVGLCHLPPSSRRPSSSLVAIIHRLHLQLPSSATSASSSTISSSFFIFLCCHLSSSPSSSSPVTRRPQLARLSTSHPRSAANRLLVSPHIPAGPPVVATPAAIRADDW